MKKRVKEYVCTRACMLYEHLWAREIISKNSEIWNGGGKNNLYVEIKMWDAGAVNLKHLIIIEHDIGYKMYANIYIGLWIIYCTKLLFWNTFLDWVDWT